MRTWFRSPGISIRAFAAVGILAFAASLLFPIVSNGAGPFDPAAIYQQSVGAVVIVINRHPVPHPNSLVPQAPSPKGTDNEEKDAPHSPIYPDPHRPRDKGDTSTDAISAATGFFIRSDGLVLTVGHVTQNPGTFRIETADGAAYDATLIGAVDNPPTMDMALLKVNAKKIFPVLPLAAAAHVYIGERLAMIGHPYFRRFSLAEAMVSRLAAKGDKLRIQIQSSILPGNSGSPLIDGNGEVVGVVFAEIDNSETLGIAISAAELSREIDALLNNGGRAL